MCRTALCVGGVALFVAGLVVGSVVTPAGAQERNAGLRLNNVQITVPNLDESLAFYTTVLGFRVAFRLPAPADGRPATTFIQINRDTFLEVVQAAANVTPGITHIGLQTDDVNATVAQVRRAGVTVADVRPTNGIGSKLATVFDHDGIRLEINEQPPGSLMRKAMDAWK